MPKFRKKPVEIDAVCWDQGLDVYDQVERWAADSNMTISSSDGCLFIDTLEGTMRADKGDWVIRGVKGELYPIKDDIFRETYESVDAT